MTHTTEQLQAMSDKEINTALAKLVFDAQGAPYTINQSVTLSKLDNIRQDCLGHELYPHAIDVICGFGMRIDYCNNPSDIMPLAFERDITWVKSHERAYHHLSDGVYGFDHGETYDDANPLRAIACLLLLIGGG